MDTILASFGLRNQKYLIEPIGTGHIHQTFLVKGEKSFVLQRVNKLVFTQPEIIAQNIRVAANYLKLHHPDYLFLSPLSSLHGKEMVYDEEGFPWRLFPYAESTVSINEVKNKEQAFEAAKGFAKLTHYLDGADIFSFKPTIEKFHDLSWRFHQFETARARATQENVIAASTALEETRSYSYLVDRYKELVLSNSIPVRITHNDTKINNILFSKTTQQAYCVIDLDTLMPGYFFYDLGDMVRTAVSPVSEEEKDISKITFRSEIYQALITGYLSEMQPSLTPAEMGLIPFAGLMMTYIMALRFLTDFLNDNKYYHITYPTQNLVRARNQLALLRVLSTELSFK